jgi:hypothetical protein
MFTDVAVLENTAINTAYMSGQDASYDSATMTQFALLSENKVLTVRATLDSATSSYSLTIFDAIDIGWSTANPLNIETPNRLVYFVKEYNGA